MAEAIVSIVVERLSNLLMEEAEALYGVRDQIEEVVINLKLIGTFLQDADSRIKEHRIIILIAEIRELVYDVEHIVESFLLQALSKERDRLEGIKNVMKTHICALHECVYRDKFGKDIKRIQKRMSEFSNRFLEYHIRATSESSSSSYERPGKLKRFYSHVVIEPGIFVGFQDDVKILVRHLVNDSDIYYPVISICGMGGLGKTTLAEKIYNHSSIRSHFESLAWISITQKWQTKVVLQQILVSLVHNENERDGILNMEISELQHNLLEIQQKERCLVVLDDIWSNEAWDCLKAAFPAENFRGKILLTSRNVGVAEYVNQKCFIHQPQLLDDEQSWELLGMKALPKGDYLDHRDIKDMEELGRKMVKNCAGLPLAIVVLGGVLVTKPTFVEWEKVHDDMLSSLRRGTGLGVEPQREVLDILGWSYNDLPLQLKPCFLYLGKFEEDVEIDTEFLYQVWIAEGMVLSSDKREAETMMEVAESYLGELVHRSMVQVTLEEEREYSSLRKFKSCRLHDLMRDLSLAKAKEEDFFKVIDQRKGNDYHLNSSVDSSSSRTQRLVIYFSSVYESTEATPFPIKKANRQCLRSVILFQDPEYGSSLPPKFISHITDFRMLRVFVFDGDTTNYQTALVRIIWTDLGRLFRNLVYLRFLRIKYEGRTFFPSIQNLELLQTLNLETDSCMYIPPWLSTDTLKKLRQLRHLHLPSGEVAYWKLTEVWRTKLRFKWLSKLEILENFDTRYCEVKDLKKLTNLRRLSACVVDSYDDAEEMIKYITGISSTGTSSCLRYLYLNITQCDLRSRNGPAILRHLLSQHNVNLDLNLFGAISELPPLFDSYHSTISSSGLTTLSLTSSVLEEDPMPVLENIHTLRTLILENRSFLGKEMVCSATGFPQLTTFTLVELLELEKWRVDPGGMPNLSRLCIQQCICLQELPVGLAFLRKLEELELCKMPKDFYNRILVINGVVGADYHIVHHVRTKFLYDPLD